MGCTSCVVLLIWLCSGGSKEGAQGTCHPGQNFFIFMLFSEKLGQIIGWRPPRGLVPPLWEILDPPLLRVKHDIAICWRISSRNLLDQTTTQKFESLQIERMSYSAEVLSCRLVMFHEKIYKCLLTSPLFQMTLISSARLYWYKFLKLHKIQFQSN